MKIFIHKLSMNDLRAYDNLHLKVVSFEPCSERVDKLAKKVLDSTMSLVHKVKTTYERVEAVP